MATFIDDQGGTGWTPGSHKHFRLAAAWIPTANVVPFQEAVRSLRRDVGLRNDYEFKFAKTHNATELRLDFYNIATRYGLRFAACSFDKMRIHPDSIEPAVFHQVCATVLAVHLRATYQEAEATAQPPTGTKHVLLAEPVIVDDNKDRGMLIAIQDAFRALRSDRFPHAGLTKKPKFRDSEKDDGIQLADMVMGAVGAHLDGDEEWYKTLRSGGGDVGVVNLSSCKVPRGSLDLCETIKAVRVVAERP